MATRPVSVGLSSDEGGCAKLAAAMFGCKPEGVDVGMINDALRELVNMTAGLLKREMALDQALSVPAIVDDKESLSEIARQHPALVLIAREVGMALWACDGLLKWNVKGRLDDSWERRVARGAKARNPLPGFPFSRRRSPAENAGGYGNPPRVPMSKGEGAVTCHVF
jgi:hypothetical protein